MEATWMTMNRWIQKVVLYRHMNISTYMHEYTTQSSIKEDRMPHAAMWTDWEMSIQSEVRERKTKLLWDHLYVKSEIWYEWTYLQIRNRLIYRKKTHGHYRGKGGGGINEGLWISRCRLLYIELKNQVLVYSTGNFIQCLIRSYNENIITRNKEIYIYLTEPLLSTPQIITTF